MTHLKMPYSYSMYFWTYQENWLLMSKYPFLHICEQEDKCVSSHTDKSVSFTLHHDDIEVILMSRGEAIMLNVSGSRPGEVALQNRWSLQDFTGLAPSERLILVPSLPFGSNSEQAHWPFWSLPSLSVKWRSNYFIEGYLAYRKQLSVLFPSYGFLVEYGKS